MGCRDVRISRKEHNNNITKQEQRDTHRKIYMSGMGSYPVEKEKRPTREEKETNLLKIDDPPPYYYLLSVNIFDVF